MGGFSLAWRAQSPAIRLGATGIGRFPPFGSFVSGSGKSRYARCDDRRRARRDANRTSLDIGSCGLLYRGVKVPTAGVARSSSEAFRTLLSPASELVYRGPHSPGVERNPASPPWLVSCLWRRHYGGVEKSPLCRVSRQSSQRFCSNCVPRSGIAPQMRHAQPFSAQRFCHTAARRRSGFSVFNLASGLEARRTPGGPVDVSALRN
jgi:hypothetical protein